MHLRSTHINLEPELLVQLTKEAKMHNRSQSDVVREALKQYFDSKKVEEENRELERTLKEIDDQNQMTHEILGRLLSFLADQKRAERELMFKTAELILKEVYALKGNNNQLLIKALSKESFEKFYSEMEVLAAEKAKLKLDQIRESMG